MNEKGINQWNNNAYLHNFVIDLTEKGAGREIIKAVEALAVNDHKERVPSTIHFLISIMNQWGMRWQEPAKMGGMKAIGVKNIWHYYREK